MAHELLWKQLLALDRQETAKRAKCQYISESQRYIITLLNNQYVVDLTEKQIFQLQDHPNPQPAEFIEQLCILSYLINAKDLPLADKLVKPGTLPGGQFFFRGPHNFSTEKLEKAFGDNPESLGLIIDKFAADRCQFGDFSIQLYILPRVPMTIIIWRSDEEFPARASILLDKTASDHLPLDALWAAGNLAINCLINAQ